MIFKIKGKEQLIEEKFFNKREFTGETSWIASIAGKYVKVLAIYPNKGYWDSSVQGPKMEIAISPHWIENIYINVEKAMDDEPIIILDKTKEGDYLREIFEDYKDESTDHNVAILNYTKEHPEKVKILDFELTVWYIVCFSLITMGLVAVVLFLIEAFNLNN